VAQKQYEALRMFFREGVKAKKVAHKFGYTYRGFTTIVSEFRKKLQNPDIVDPFFIEKNKGRKTSNTVNEAKDMIVGDEEKVLFGGGYKGGPGLQRDGVERKRRP
jgi:predicted DNA-binding protein (UPF0251 family)